jgi:hypothetical protein
MPKPMPEEETALLVAAEEEEEGECECPCEACAGCEHKAEEVAEKPSRPMSRMEKRGSEYASARKKMRKFMGKADPMDEEWSE